MTPTFIFTQNIQATFWGLLGFFFFFFLIFFLFFFFFFFNMLKAVGFNP